MGGGLSGGSARAAGWINARDAGATEALVADVNARLWMAPGVPRQWLKHDVMSVLPSGQQGQDAGSLSSAIMSAQCELLGELPAWAMAGASPTKAFTTGAPSSTCAATKT